MNPGAKNKPLPKCLHGGNHDWSLCVFCLQVKPRGRVYLPACYNVPGKRHRWLLCAKCGIFRKRWRRFNAGDKMTGNVGQTVSADGA